MKLDPRTFLKAIADHTKNENFDSADKPMRLGMIDATYNGVGLPRVLFDGELVVSSKRYAIMQGYSPAAGDRVALAPVGTTYLIVGKILETVPAGWVNLTLTGGWTQQGGFATVGCKLYPDGTVGLRGSMVPGTLTDGTIVFTLPAGYRPADQQVILVNSVGSPAQSRIRIMPSGAVDIFNCTSSTGLRLSGLRFPII